MLLSSILVATLSLWSSSSPIVAWQNNFTVTGRPEIKVASKNVSIRVYASQRADIQATLFTDKGLSKEAASITNRQSGRVLELDVRMADNWTSGLRQAPVLELRIPLASDVDLRSENGSVIVRETEGKLTIVTDKGNIEAVGIRGALDVESGHGDLKVDGTVTAVRLDTRSGNVQAQINHGSTMDSGWIVRTGDGNVDLGLPAGFSADLDVQAMDGNIHLDFPVAGTGSERQSRIRGPINGGGQHLELHSDKGNIMVRHNRSPI
jgi:hypothetical protein